MDLSHIVIRKTPNSLTSLKWPGQILTRVSKLMPFQDVHLMDEPDRIRLRRQRGLMGVRGRARERERERARPIDRQGSVESV